MFNVILEEIKRMKAIADIGLLYSKNPYDEERYRELQQIAFRLLEHLTNNPTTQLKASMPTPQDYPTAKVDVRGLLLRPDQKILLVRESADGKWSLPGGWADIGLSPKEVIIKEFKEETGLDVIPTRLLAVFDKRKHHHPPQPFYVYKFVFLCEAKSSVIYKGFDVLDVDYFDPEDLPSLSEDRILKSQISMLIKEIIPNPLATYVD